MIICSLKFVALIINTQVMFGCKKSVVKNKSKHCFSLSRYYTLKTWITLVFLFPAMHVQLNLVLG
jgi:hypothetical protein